jgi:HD-GYP domain-containing protein (c-di-GMP phosphodiesterase class II)
VGEIALWIQMYHERPDGQGYLPRPTRIFAVADSYWELRAKRPHRDGLSSTEVIELIVAVPARNTIW